MRGFARTEQMNREDINDTTTLQKIASEHEKIQPRPEQWSIVPSKIRGFSESNQMWAPLILTTNILHTTGDPACTRPPHLPGGGAQACVPLYRTKFAYVFKARTEAWLGSGALCLRYSNEGTTTGVFMVDAGLAESASDAEKTYGNGPCVRASTLSAAFDSATAWLATLSAHERDQLTSTRGRRQRRLQERFSYLRR
jgi:hypothetical protein